MDQNSAVAHHGTLNINSRIFFTVLIIFKSGSLLGSKAHWESFWSDSIAAMLFNVVIIQLYIYIYIYKLELWCILFKFP